MFLLELLQLLKLALQLFLLISPSFGDLIKQFPDLLLHKTRIKVVQVSLFAKISRILLVILLSKGQQDLLKFVLQLRMAQHNYLRI